MSTWRVFPIASGEKPDEGVAGFSAPISGRDLAARIGNPFEESE